MASESCRTRPVKSVRPVAATTMATTATVSLLSVGKVGDLDAGMSGRRPSGPPFASGRLAE